MMTSDQQEPSESALAILKFIREKFSSPISEFSDVEKSVCVFLLQKMLSEGEVLSQSTLGVELRWDGGRKLTWLTNAADVLQILHRDNPVLRRRIEKGGMQ